MTAVESCASRRVLLDDVSAWPAERRRGAGHKPSKQLPPRRLSGDPAAVRGSSFAAAAAFGGTAGARVRSDRPRQREDDGWYGERNCGDFSRGRTDRGETRRGDAAAECER